MVGGVANVHMYALCCHRHVSACGKLMTVLRWVEALRTFLRIVPLGVGSRVCEL